LIQYFSSIFYWTVSDLRAGLAIYYVHFFCIKFLDITLLCFTGQRDTTGLSAENAELKIRLQAMEQQAQLRDGESLTFSQ
jgi:hypothetical protein